MVQPFSGGFRLIYALDIGTRTVVGVLAEKGENGISILDFEMLEHEERAMLDGAIHDVQKVSNVVARITQTLSQRNSLELREASVALAGRFLKTSVGEAQQDVEREPSISRETVRTLEMDAINDSIQKLDLEGREMYCVGYSVLYYSLDGEWIKNLEGHRGHSASVKVLAAFLPAYIVNAMMNVLEKTGLIPSHITLEPIAAMNLVVPPDLRKLNIVLIDVGAGTSDIAVSRDNTVIAYGMVPMAGDEITERLCDEFLLDFSTGEKVKRRLSDGEENVVVHDILDSEVSLDRSTFLQTVEPVLEEITRRVCDEILSLNGKAPVAVMVIGGGARIPGFTASIAEKLSLPANRVALKSVENLASIDDRTDRMVGSDFVTPVGIANSLHTNTGSVFVRVLLNGKSVDLMALDNKNTVMQALLQSGFSPDEIIGKPGPAITCEINGKLHVLKGSVGKEAKVLINSKPARVEDRLKHGDIVEVKPGSRGKSPSVYLSELLPVFNTWVNDHRMELPPAVFRNGKPLDQDVLVQDGDTIAFDQAVEVARVYASLGMEEKEYWSILFNGLIRNVCCKEHLLFLGERKVHYGDSIPPGSRLSLKTTEHSPRIRNLLQEMSIPMIEVHVNGKSVKIPAASFQISIDGLRAELDSPLFDNANVVVEITPIIPKVIDIFSVLDFDVSDLKSFSIEIQGQKAAFMDSLSEGDHVEIIIQK